MRKRLKNLGNLLELLNENILYMFGNLAILALISTFTFYHFKNLPSKIPLFYNVPWGEMQLASKNTIVLIPIIMFAIYFVNLAFVIIETRQGQYNVSKLYNYATSGLLIISGSYLFRIITISSTVNVEIPQIIKLIIIPMFFAFLSSVIVIPFVIKIARRFGFMDDPLTHKHPAMLIKMPTPRAGGLAYFISILIPALFLIPILESKKIIGILVGSLICVTIGIFDDKKDIHPGIRMFFQILTVIVTVLSGIILFYIPNPFGNPVLLDQYKIVLNFWGDHTVYYVSVFIAVAWVLTSMNFMSFANGSDGVYAGLVFVASFVIAILMYQTLDVDPNMAKFVKLSALSAGAAIGMAIFTWPPQKLLWGFGATSAGLIISSLSIIGSTKIAVLLLVLLIPFLDGLTAVIRRIKRGQLPFWGDREHLHHKLLFRLGWSKSKVATFYWISTLCLGIAGILSSGKSRALWLVSLSLIFFVLIALMNLIKNPKQPEVR